MAEKADKVKELIYKLEFGTREIFESDRYADYLRTMARFHRYSARNTLLIYMQNPTATMCNGFEKWKEFGRHIKRGEKGITILAPIPLNFKQETEKLDDDTKMPLYDNDGKPIVEEVEVNLTKFKPVTIFDASQTDGEPLVTLVEDIPGNVQNYNVFMKALRQISPLPIEFEQMQQDGYCRYGEKIGIRENMSEIQTICAIIHEIAHAKLYDSERANEKPKDKRAQEVISESVAYVVTQYYGIETDKNSLAYIVSWGRDKELKELKSSLEIIRRTAAELIDSIDEKFRRIAAERGIDITAEIEKTSETVEDSKVMPTVDITTTMPIIPVETRPVGTNVLMPPLFDDMLLNRNGKKIRVTVEKPIGKYPIYSHEENGEKVLYFLTASGRITRIWDYFANEWDDELHKYVSVRPTEARFDEAMKQVAERFERAMADRKRFVLYQDTAVLNRLEECDTHNQPIRELRRKERERKIQDSAEREKSERRERDDNFKKTVDELAEKIIRGEKANVEIDSYKNKNPMFSLFDRYKIDLPLATKGWINRNLRAFQFTDGGRKRLGNERIQSIGYIYQSSMETESRN
ncbi:MAG: ArdC-like ssDNA-binding domain-containing protein [Oscillospiraceae bacterium]|nr:ArdC-like ssDNA-binding domain-containing protein [Oscillospiraceae bacterium]